VIDLLPAKPEYYDGHAAAAKTAGGYDRGASGDRLPRGLPGGNCCAGIGTGTRARRWVRHQDRNASLPRAKTNRNRRKQVRAFPCKRIDRNHLCNACIPSTTTRRCPSVPRSINRAFLSLLLFFFFFSSRAQDPSYLLYATGNGDK
jgi:hypothetical protein